MSTILYFFYQKLLTNDRKLCAEYLEANYDQMFTHFHQLLKSKNYVTRSQSMRLIHELLSDNISVSKIQFAKFNHTF